MKKYISTIGFTLTAILCTSCATEISTTKMSAVFPDSTNHLRKGCTYRVDYNNKVGGLGGWEVHAGNDIQTAVRDTMKEAGPNCIGLADVVILTTGWGEVVVRVEGHPIYRN